MNRYSIAALSACLLAMCSLPTFAQEADEEAPPAAAGSATFYKEKAEGWFWYKDPAEEVIKKEKPKKKPPVAEAPPPEPEAKPEEPKPEVKGPEMLSVAWIRANLPKFRDRAIDNPTRENIQAYYYLQRVMMDKSSKFSEESSKAIMRDPFLDEDSRRPVSTYAANAMNRAAGQARDKVVGDIAKQAGLFFFFKSNCILCDEQASVLQALATKSGINILPVSLDGGPLGNGLYPEYQINAGQAEKLSIYQAPAIAMVIPPSKTEIVGYGAITMDVLQNRLLMVAQETGLIDEKTYQSTQPVQENGLIAMDDIGDMDADAIEDPAAFVQRMQQVLAKKNAGSDIQ